MCSLSWVGVSYIYNVHVMYSAGYFAQHEGQQYVPKTACLSDNFFEKAVLRFEAHCPQGRQWSKFP